MTSTGLGFTRGHLLPRCTHEQIGWMGLGMEVRPEPPCWRSDQGLGAPCARACVSVLVTYPVWMAVVGGGV